MNVIIDDLLVQYADEGAGPVVIFLHGWGSSLQAFDGLTESLKSDFRVIRIDLPGFGGSQKPRTDWFIKDYANFVAAFLKKIGIDELYACAGHSFGGRVIIKAVALGSIVPKRVILMGSAGIKPQYTLKQHLIKAVAKTGKIVMSLPLLSKLSAPLKKQLYQASGSTDYMNAGEMKNIFLNTINEDLREDAAKSPIPTMLIWGEDDTATPVADGRLLDKIIPHSRLQIISGAGHYVFLDKPEETLLLIQECLDD